MYRMLPVPNGSRALELCFDAQAVLAGFEWPGECAAICALRHPGTRATHALATPADGRIFVADCRAPLPFRTGSFDLVFCHRGLDRLVASDPEIGSDDGLRRFVARTADVLADNGVLALCVTNTSAASRLIATMVARRDSSRGTAGPGRSIGRWRALLQTAGLHDVQAFTVVPAADAPLRLINTEPDLSRIGFRREIESIRSALSGPAYLLRIAAAKLGLQRWLEPSLLVWGVRR